MNTSFMRHLAILVFLAVSTTCHITSVIADERPESSSVFAIQNYERLNNAFILYQSAAVHPWQAFPAHTRLLKLGAKSTAVLQLRDHLRTTQDLSPADDTSNEVFDKKLSEAVKIFQERHGLKADGVVGENTRAELNISPIERLRQIQINLQRWADLSNELGDRFLMVNIPDFHLYLIEDGKKIMQLRTVVGKPTLPTPEISSVVTTIEFNPSWNIPSKIVRKEIAPKMMEDPDYLAKMHIRVFQDEEEDSPQINPHDIDWHAASENGLDYHLKQDPGADNALGQVKFEFQNTADVYLHDTPAKNLFDVDIRDFSHGCIRLENPFALVDYLMKDNPSWSEEKLHAILDAGKTKYVKVDRPIPIFITYITAWVDENGKVNFRHDVYGQDED